MHRPLTSTAQTGAASQTAAGIALRLRRALGALAVVYAAVGCAGIGGPKAEWATAPDVDLGAFSTFDWADGSRDTPQTILDSRVRDALRDELVTKGYEQSSDAPDFLIGYETVEHERGQRSSPLTIGIGVGTWGSRVGGRVGTTVGVGGGEADLRYRLAIRALEADGSRELWVGATSTFELPPEERAIDRAVSGVMRGFPDRH